MGWQRTPQLTLPLAGLRFAMGYLTAVTRFSVAEWCTQSVSTRDPLYAA